MQQGEPVLVPFILKQTRQRKTSDLIQTYDRLPISSFQSPT